MTNEEFEDLLNSACLNIRKLTPEEKVMYDTGRKLAILEVLLEREQQVVLWGMQSFEDPSRWLGILTEEVGEVAEAINETVLENATKKHKGGLENIKKELIQVAAVAISAIEDINFKISKQLINEKKE